MPRSASAMMVPALPLPDFDSHDSLLKHRLLHEYNFFLKQPSGLNPALNTDKDEIIQNATAFAPHERYPSCGAFKKMLDRYQKRHL